MQNYDPSSGKPYLRVSSMTITTGLNAPRHAECTVYHEWAVLGEDGRVYRAAGDPVLPMVFTVRVDATEPYPLINPANGAALGPTTCDRDVMLAILAAIHHRRKDLL